MKNISFAKIKSFKLFIGTSGLVILSLIISLLIYGLSFGGFKITQT